MKKIEPIIFICFHFIYTFCIFWSNIYYVDLLKSSFFNLIFPLMLYLIGMVTYIVTYKNTATLIFYILLVSIGIILLLPNTFFSYIVISIFPTLLYFFCVYFLHVDANNKTLILGNILICFSVFMIVLFILNVYVGIYIVIFSIFTLISIIAVSFREVSTRIFKYTKLLIAAVLIAIIPFILSVILTIMNVDSIFNSVDLFYTFAILPLAVGYILIEENSIAIYYTKKELFILFITFVLFVVSAMTFLIFGLNISEFNTAIILMIFLLIAYLYTIIINHYSSNKIDNINENLYENRRVEFLHKQKFVEIKDRYLDYILNDIQNTLLIHNSFIAFEENGQLQIFLQDNNITREVIVSKYKEFQDSNHGYFEINEMNYYIQTFSLLEDICGIVGIGRKEKFSSEDIKMIEICINNNIKALQDIFELANLQQSYISLPGIHPQDFVIEKYQYEMNKIQQDESQYLHDVILQKMVGVKNYLEVIETSNIEFKEYMLEEISDMNNSIINHMYDLFPFTLKNLSLHECISELVTRIKTTPEYNMLKPDIKFDMNSSLQARRFLFYPIYSFVKELIMNSLIFSEATSISISIEIIEKYIVLIYTDNGNRENIKDIIYDSYDKKKGMIFLNYEVSELNGLMFIETGQPSGIIVTIKLPL